MSHFHFPISVVGGDEREIEALYTGREWAERCRCRKSLKNGFKKKNGGKKKKKG